MAFVSVRLLGPDGTPYRLQIDDEASVDVVKNKLIAALALDTTKKYQLTLIDALRVEPDIQIRIIEVEEEAIRGLELAE